jgi:hypothetical protein
VIDRDGRIEPTEAAFEKTGIPRKKSARTRGQLLDMWLAALPSPAKDILRTVASQRGAVRVEDVGAELGLATRGGHWNAGVSMLRTNNLIAITPHGFELGSALSVAP